MKVTLKDHIQSERARAADECTACGLCAKVCPAVRESSLSSYTPRQIQLHVRKHLQSGTGSPLVRQRAESCLECFGCLSVCPQGLMPMHVLQSIRAELSGGGEYEDPAGAESGWRIMAAAQTRPQDYRRIFASPAKASADTVFFPGCNVYKQPDKLLSALDLLDLIGDDYAFLPGLENCCGNVDLEGDRLDRAGDRADKLIERLASFNPKQVVLWCPTCHCLFSGLYARWKNLPFKVVSFTRHLADNMGRLDLTRPDNRKVTLHEACKSALTGADLSGPRDVLKGLGLDLEEMPRSGERAVCCGGGAVGEFAFLLDRLRDSRLDEAAAVGASTLVDVCHYCHVVFAAHAERHGIDLVNYVTLAARAAGLERNDLYLRWKSWADVDRIMDDAASNIAAGPFSVEQTRRVMEDIFGRAGS